MAIVTIPKKMAKDDLVIIPRKEYEELLFRAPRVVKEVPMTTSEKRHLPAQKKI